MSLDLEYEKWVRAAFRLIPGLGSGRLQQLINNFGSAQTAWELILDNSVSLDNFPLVTTVREFRSRIDIDKIRQEYQARGISLVIPEESCYPELISNLPDAPPLLYYRGSLEPNAKGVAIVGARKATPYGKAAAKYLSQELAKTGLVVVSGLARGIDTAAHEGALAENGVTWAFLGCGVDITYPRENKNLADRIIANGALISEFTPGTSPEASHFPARNRLISGASMGVIVVEAAVRSGALITVDFALEQGREVFAVPGPIFSEMSKGTNQLLRSGAKLVEGLDDVTTELNHYLYGQESNESKSKDSDSTLDPNEEEPNLFNQKMTRSREQEEILSQLSDLPLHIDEIVTRCTSSQERLALALLELKLEGMIEQLPGQCYVLARLG